MFGDIERRYNLPEGYLARVRQIESNNGQNTFNRMSGAAGDFQFIPSTARQYGLTNPYDTMSAADAAARLAADNRTVLTRNGIDPNAANLYLAHQQGAQGAVNLLNSSAPAGSVVGERAVAWNGGDPSASAGDFARRILERFSGNQAGLAAPAWNAVPSNLPTPAGWDRAMQPATPYGDLRGAPPASFFNTPPAVPGQPTNALTPNLQPYPEATPLPPADPAPAATPGIDPLKLFTAGAQMLQGSQKKEEAPVPFTPAPINRPQATQMPQLAQSNILQAMQRRRMPAGLLGG